ncbi:hypothetical protein C8J57DRAFT_1211985 [Mycena rebaudengoi]|nr:hypothetical protein C8J57DRAFT_1211985 [Mycena rebaudengoi]
MYYVFAALLFLVAGNAGVIAAARETNGQRMANGLPPLPPRWMATRTHGYTTTSRRPSPSPTPSLSSQTLCQEGILLAMPLLNLLRVVYNASDMNISRFTNLLAPDCTYNAWGLSESSSTACLARARVYPTNKWFHLTCYTRTLLTQDLKAI